MHCNHSATVEHSPAASLLACARLISSDSSQAGQQVHKLMLCVPPTGAVALQVSHLSAGVGGEGGCISCITTHVMMNSIHMVSLTPIRFIQPAIKVSLLRRAMVCVALLCAAQVDTALQETAQHLLCFLITYPTPEPLYGEGQSTLLLDTLTALSSAARSSTTFPDTTDGDIFQTSQAAACLPALVQLLENVASTAMATGTFSAMFSDWFRRTFVDASDAYPSSVFLELLPLVVPFLRSHTAAFACSEIFELSQQLLSRSAKLPPAAAVMSQSPNPEKLTEVLQTLDIICACFPCPSTPLGTPRGGQPTTAVGQGSAAAEALAMPEERQALLAATLRQMQGERSVALAAAAARRVTEGQEDDSSAAAAASTSGG